VTYNFLQAVGPLCNITNSVKTLKNDSLWFQDSIPPATLKELFTWTRQHIATIL